MDDLDRLFRRLVHCARAASPEYVTRPFEVAEIYHTLVPYRLNRRELGFDSVQQYEQTLMRLLAGERGYLTGDADMQRAMREELAAAVPDTSAFRAFATAPVAFAPDALRAVEGETRPASRPDAGHPLRGEPQSPSPAPPSTPVSLNPASPPPSEPPAAAPLLAPMNAGVRIAGQPAPAPAQPTAPAPSATQAATRGAADAPRAADQGSCPYCSGKLPEGRELTFCPHCGQNLTVRHCPACSTELEVGWKFCITCGRNVEGVGPG